jgi:hypothetical protein
MAKHSVALLVVHVPKPAQTVPFLKINMVVT